MARTSKKTVPESVKNSLKGVMKTSKSSQKDRKAIRKRRKESFSTYIYKVLRQIHPDTGISSRSMIIMNSFVQDMFERIATEASRLLHKSKKRTMSADEIKTAVMLILPGDLASHACAEGVKALHLYDGTKYEDSQQKNQQQSQQQSQQETNTQ